MEERVQAAIYATGDLGAKVEAHRLAALALVDEIKAAQAIAQHMADDALDYTMSDEYKLAMAKVAEYDLLIWAIQTSGR